MPWRAGVSPVANDDHATGEMDGQVVESGMKLPDSISLLKFGILPWPAYSFVSFGSSPSSPTTTTRPTSVFLYPFFLLSAKMSALAGHIASAAAAMNIAANMTKNEPTNANPAPGPM